LNSYLPSLRSSSRLEETLLRIYKHRSIGPTKETTINSVIPSRESAELRRFVTKVISSRVAVFGWSVTPQSITPPAYMTIV
ncbi:hypothetical protein XENOCAPTIV_015949, partial [Xenoophorus captivus]